MKAWLYHSLQAYSECDDSWHASISYWLLKSDMNFSSSASKFGFFRFLLLAPFCKISIFSFCVQEGGTIFKSPGQLEVRTNSGIRGNASSPPSTICYHWVLSATRLLWLSVGSFWEAGGRLHTTALVQTQARLLMAFLQSFPRKFWSSSELLFISPTTQHKPSRRENPQVEQEALGIQRWATGGIGRKSGLECVSTLWSQEETHSGCESRILTWTWTKWNNFHPTLLDI